MHTAYTYRSTIFYIIYINCRILCLTSALRTSDTHQESLCLGIQCSLTQFDVSSLSGKITVLNGTQDLPPSVAQVLTLCGSRKYPLPPLEGFGV